MAPASEPGIEFLNRRSHDQHIARAETEIAVLQVQVTSLDEKVDEIKTGMKDIRSSVDKGNENTLQVMKDFQAANELSHKEINDKISFVEKWKWMIMGAIFILGLMGIPAAKEIVSLFAS